MDTGLAILSLVAMRDIGRAGPSNMVVRFRPLCLLSDPPSTTIEAVSVLVVPPPFFFQHLNQEALGLNRKEPVTA